MSAAPQGAPALDAAIQVPDPALRPLGAPDLESFGYRRGPGAAAYARALARDSLVKTALFGSDPNWGRVLAAIGIAPIELVADRISVSFNGSAVCIDGAGAPGARDVDLSGADIEVIVDLSIGEHEATIRTTDLSHAYVEENSAYSS